MGLLYSLAPLCGLFTNSQKKRVSLIEHSLSTLLAIIIIIIIIITEEWKGVTLSVFHKFFFFYILTQQRDIYLILEPRRMLHRHT